MTWIRVLGSIDAVHGDTAIAVGGPALRNLLAVLVAAGDRGATSSVIADNLWSDERRPSDPGGAVRVYVGRLRKTLGDASIITSDTGYRLGALSSDAADFEKLVAEARSESNPERARFAWGRAVDLWRGDAFAGSEDLPIVEPVARRLDELRLDAVEAWIAARLAAGEIHGLVSDVEAMVRKQPLHEGFRSLHMTSLATAGRQPAALETFQEFRRELAEIGLVPSQRLVDLDADIVRGEDVVRRHRLSPAREIDEGQSVRRLEILRGCSSSWLRGDPVGAVEILMAGADEFEPDVTRRIHRCLTTVPAGEPLSRQLWGFMIQEWLPLPAIGARTFASMDARALELLGSDGLGIADSEIGDAETQAELVRSLRVRFQVGMGSPIDERQLETVRRLAAIDDPDAMVEAARFEAIICVKQGRMVDAVEHLHRYAAVVADVWPDSLDDFAPMALHVLAMHPDRDELGIPAMPGPGFPVFTADAFAARVSAAWHEEPASPSDRTLPYGFTQVLDTTTPDCATALQLRWCLRTDQLDKAVAHADHLHGRIEVMPRDRWHQAVPVALAEYALRTGDADMADAARRLLEPWRGEVLGLWPSDAIIGPADRVLDKLAGGPRNTSSLNQLA